MFTPLRFDKSINTTRRSFRLCTRLALGGLAVGLGVRVDVGVDFGVRVALVVGLGCVRIVVDALGSGKGGCMGSWLLISLMLVGLYYLLGRSICSHEAAATFAQHES